MPVIKQFTNNALFSHPKYRETLLFTQNLGLERQNMLGITARITLCLNTPQQGCESAQDIRNPQTEGRVMAVTKGQKLSKQ